MTPCGGSGMKSQGSSRTGIIIHYFSERTNGCPGKKDTVSRLLCLCCSYISTRELVDGQMDWAHSCSPQDGSLVPFGSCAFGFFILVFPLPHCNVCLTGSQVTSGIWASDIVWCQIAETAWERHEDKLLLQRCELWTTEWTTGDSTKGNSLTRWSMPNSCSCFARRPDIGLSLS